MTAYQTCNTILCDGDAESAWDGEFCRISLFGNVHGKGADAVMVGQIILTPHTILRMHNAVNKGMNTAFTALVKPEKAKIVKYRRPSAAGES